jgi:peptide/nickel transport system substrate-binding protein
LVRNENWNPDTDDFRKALPDKVVVKFAQDEKGIDEYIINGTGPGKTALSLDGIYPDNLEAVFSSADMESRRLNDYDIYVTYTAINVAKMTCLPIRQAVFYALDREALRALGGGSQFGGDFADGVIKPATLPTDYKAVTGYEDALPEGNPAKATELMEQAKTECPDEYERVTTEGITRDYADSDVARQGFAITQEALAKAGIVLKANFIDAGSYYGVILNPETQGDLSGAGWGPDWLNASTVIPPLFIENGGFNVSQTQFDPKYEEFKALVDAAKANPDRASQGAQWAALNQYVMDQMWVIPGLFTKTQYHWGSDLTGVYLWAPYGCPGFNDIGVKN